MKQILYFSLGACLGAALSHYLTKIYYENIIDDEIESVKEAYKGSEEDEDKYKKAVEAMKEYGVPGGNYNNVERLDLVRPGDEEEVAEDDFDEEVTNPFPGERVQTPYIIGPDAYHDEYNDVFDKVTVTYWAGNNTLVTDEDEILDIDEKIGRDSLEHFGEYEDDTVFVRNERLGMDFEVVYAEGEYSD